MQLTRARLVGGLGALVLAASLIAPAASAGSTPGSITLRGPVEINNEPWVQKVVGTDGLSSDTVTVTLSKVHQSAGAYKLREEHTYSFPNLDADTVVINDDVTGSIDIVNEVLDLPTGGLLTMSVDLVKIAGKKAASLCGGDLRKRQVAVAGGATFSLAPLEAGFGLIEGIPDTGTFTVERGECDSEPPCRTLSRALMGESSRELLGLDESFQWEKRQNFLKDKITIDVGLEREIAPVLEVVGTLTATLTGTIENGGVGANATTFVADGLPLLSGSAVLSNLGALDKGPWVDCSKFEIYREEVRTGDQSGTLAFTPTGLTGTNLSLPWTSSDGAREFVNWAEIGPPFP